MTPRLDCKYEIAYVYRVNEVYRIPARPTFHSFRNSADALNEIRGKFIRTNVALNYFSLSISLYLVIYLFFSSPPPPSPYFSIHVTLERLHSCKLEIKFVEVIRICAEIV